MIMKAKNYRFKDKPPTRDIWKNNTQKSLFRNTLLLPICLSLLLLSTTIVNAQYEQSDNMEDQSKDMDNDDDYKMFDAGVHLKNMHIWHGFVVHHGPMIATNLEFNTRDKKFTFGFWGGTSFTREPYNYDGETFFVNYKEFDLYAVYRFSDKFYAEAVTHNNYTGVQERGDELHYWSYDKTQGYNFVDINFGYNVTPNTLLYLATIIGGGSGDFEVAEDGSFENSWTQYFEIKSKVWENDDYKLSLFAGGAWSFFTEKTFYTEGQGNVINLGMALGRDINIGNFNMPVEVTAMWNPEKEITVLSLDFAIF